MTTGMSGWDGKETKAFGKFSPRRRGGLRRYEQEMGIVERNAWRSVFPSVQNLLDHLRRYTKSASSREKYLCQVAQFCRWARMGPEDLVKLPKTRIELLIQDWVDGMEELGRSRSYLNCVIKRLRTFFHANGFVGEKELNIRTYFMPTRYRKVPEYIPTKEEVYCMANAVGNTRDRAIILCLFSSGLRVSTLLALNYGDVVEELERGEDIVKMPVYPAMKERVPEACKGQIPYYTFICREATEALRCYLREREERYGRIKMDDPLFHSEWTLWDRDVRSSKRLTRATVGKIVKRAAKLAGISQWEHVTPHALRKAFEMVLVSQTIDGGRMDKATQEFLMGHILPGSQDYYYDKTRVDFHRKEYAKLDFSTGVQRETVDKLVSIDEVEEYLASGWLFVAKVDDNKIIVRKD